MLGFLYFFFSLSLCGRGLADSVTPAPALGAGGAARKSTGMATRSCIDDQPMISRVSSLRLARKRLDLSSRSLVAAGGRRGLRGCSAIQGKQKGRAGGRSGPNTCVVATARCRKKEPVLL